MCVCVVGGGGGAASNTSRLYSTCTLVVMHMHIYAGVAFMLTSTWVHVEEQSPDYQREKKDLIYYSVIYSKISGGRGGGGFLCI